MRLTEEQQLALAYSLLYFIPTSICIGILSGTTISLRADNIEHAGKMARISFDILILLLVALNVFVVYRKREYWLRLVRLDAGQAFGQAVGIAIGSSLAASLFFNLIISSIPYWIGNFETTGYYRHLSSVLTLGRHFALVGMSALFALLTLWRIRMQNPE